jgi:hypothetical protein
VFVVKQSCLCEEKYKSVFPLIMLSVEIEWYNFEDDRVAYDCDGGGTYLNNWGFSLCLSLSNTLQKKINSSIYYDMH